jgi:hypothetical protein
VAGKPDAKVIGGALQILSASSVSPRTTAGLVPDETDLRAAVSSASASWAAFVRNYLDTAIKGIWQSPGLKTLVENLVRKEADVSGFTRPPPVVLDARWSRKKTEPHLDLKLAGSLDASADHPDSAPLDYDVVRGLTVAEAYFSTGNLPAMASQDDAVRTVLDLRAFEGSLIRIAAAKRASEASNASLDWVLAFFRTEGNLVAPSSKATLALEVPPIEPDFKYWLSMKGSLHYPNLTNGVWFMEKPDFIDAWGSDDPAFIKFRALMEWMLVALGFDRIDAVVMGTGTLDAKLLSRKLAATSMLLWRDAGLVSVLDPREEMVATAQAQQRVDAMLQNLVLEEVTQGGVTVLQVSVIDPVAHLGAILTEGVALLIGFALSNGSVERLAYLAYNSQHVYSVESANEDFFLQISISAMQAASVSTDPKFADLKAQLAPIAFPPKLGKGFDYEKLRKKIADIGVTWAVEDLAEFICTAPKSQWRSWQEHRANLIRFSLLLAYYGKALQ